MEFDLVACNGMPLTVEDEEARRGGATIQAANEPVPPQLLLRLTNSRWQDLFGLGEGNILDMLGIKGFEDLQKVTLRGRD